MHGHFCPCGTGRNACATETHVIPAHRERCVPAPGLINDILYMRSSQIATSDFLVPTLRVDRLHHRSAVPARRASETTNAPRSGAAACRRRASAREKPWFPNSGLGTPSAKLRFAMVGRRRIWMPSRCQAPRNGVSRTGITKRSLVTRDSRSPQAQMSDFAWTSIRPEGPLRSGQAEGLARSPAIHALALKGPFTHRC